MISGAIRRTTAVAAFIILAGLIAVSAAVSARGASQPEKRQIGVTTLTNFRVVLTATRGGPGHRLRATVTATGFRRSDGHWQRIATKLVGSVNGWFWFSVEPCSLTATQLKNNNVTPSPPVIVFDSMRTSLLITPAIGCSSTFTKHWTP